MIGDPLFINIKDRASQRLPQIIDALKRNYIDDSIQRRNLQNLSNLYFSRINELNRVLVSKDSTVRLKVVSLSAEFSENSEEQVDSMVLIEEMAMADINKELSKNLSSAPVNFLIVISVFVLVLLLAYLSLSKQLVTSQKLQNNLEESNSSLEIANTSLAHSQAFLKSLLYSNPNSIVTYIAIRDNHGKIQDFELTFQNSNKLVGADGQPEDVIGKRMKEVFPTIDQTDLFKNMVNTIETSQPRSIEVFYPHDGRVHGYYEVHISKLNDGVVLNGRNIDHIKYAQKELERSIHRLNEQNREIESANEQLRQFTFIASHDLQEPLRKITMFSDMIINKAPKDPEIEGYVSKLHGSVSKMSDLIKAIGKYSRLQLKQVNLQLVDLNKIMQQVIDDLNPVITEKNASITISELPTINCDPQQISQLFMHLLSNSLKFTYKKPEIQVQCMLVDDPLILNTLKYNFSYYRFRFIDNGIGFSNEFSEKLFVIFQKLHDESKFPGTGLGLALCQKVVENHKGKISAYSKENEGSTFDVYLPANLQLNQ